MRICLHASQPVHGPGIKLIPKSFNLAGHTYSVEVVDEDEWIDDDSVGLCLQERQTILIRGILTDSTKQHTFCHELVHAILHAMGEKDLDDDEQFVDLFGSLLHQVWTTVK